MNIVSNRDENSNAKKPKLEIFSVILAIVSLLFCLAIITDSLILGGFGKLLRIFALGVFGFSAYPIFIGALVASIMLFMKRRISMQKKTMIAFLCMFLTGILSIHLFTTGNMYGSGSTYGGYLAACYNGAVNGFSTTTGGGVLFGLLVYPIAKYLSIVAAYIFIIGAFLLSTFIACNHLFIRSSGNKQSKLKVNEYRNYPLEFQDDDIRQKRPEKLVKNYTYTEYYDSPKESMGVNPNVQNNQNIVREKQEPIKRQANSKPMFIETINGNDGFALKSKKQLKTVSSTDFDIMHIGNTGNTDYLSVDDKKKAALETLHIIKPKQNTEPYYAPESIPQTSYLDDYQESQVKKFEDHQSKIDYILKKPDITELYPDFRDNYYNDRDDSKGIEKPTMIVHNQYQNSDDTYTSYVGYNAASPMFDVKEKRVSRKIEKTEDNIPQSSIPPKINIVDKVENNKIFESRRTQPREDKTLSKIVDFSKFANNSPIKEDNYFKNADIEQEKSISHAKKVTNFEQLAIDPQEIDEPTSVSFKEDTTPKNIDGSNRKVYRRKVAYNAPPIELITPRHMDMDTLHDSYTEKGAILEETLSEFGVPAKISNIVKGPTVTRYELMMPRGIKVKKVLDVANDIAMRLESVGNIRIEAPIPGKNLLGIEVPNSQKLLVGLREVIDSPEFRNTQANLAFAIGKDVAGNNIVSNIAKMPHLLVAGATGMGKSVCLNSLIVSLLYKSSPDDVKLMLIDPKRVEFSVYNGLPHMLLPKAIIENDKAMSALNWAINEMERRYTIFANYNARDVLSYHEKYNPDTDEKLPYIVIIVDEFNDLMVSGKGDIEEKIIRLTQKSRAAGIHLVLATQRPTIDVISGTIKNNLPSRIAFKVISSVDSKTILDTGGAEDLLGNGDMLYMSATSPQNKRLQGAYISMQDVEEIVEYIKDNNEAYFDELLEQTILADRQVASSLSSSSTSSDDDAIKLQALKYIVVAKQASISFLQKKMSIGYPRASRIIDLLEEDGYISQYDGSKPRQVLITQEEYEALLSDRKE